MVIPCRRTRCAGLLALAAAHCQPANAPSSPGEAAFPVGTYTTCAQGVHNPSGNTFPNIAGFEAGAVLTLAQNASTVTATYVDQNDLSQTLTFEATTASSGALAAPAQADAGFASLCVQGPGQERAWPATMEVDDGAIAADAGTVFVDLTGSLVSDAGDCGVLYQSDATFWLLCEVRDGGPVPPDDAPPPAAQLPVGQYTCAFQVESTAQFDGLTWFVADGAAGTLALTQDGTTVSAEYTGDAYLDGTLRFALTSPTTARAEPGQTVSTPCTIPLGTGIPPLTLHPLPVDTGSLALVGSTLFVSFTGSLGAACVDDDVAGALICSKSP